MARNTELNSCSRLIIIKPKFVATNKSLVKESIPSLTVTVIIITATITTTTIKSAFSFQQCLANPFAKLATIATRSR